MANKDRDRSIRPAEATDAAARDLTPNRGGDFVDDDVSVRDAVQDPGSYQSNHGTSGMGGDDERADADDYKVTGQSRG